MNQKHRKKRKRTILRGSFLLVILLLISYTFYSQSQTEIGSVQVGDGAPNLSLYNILDDQVIELESFKGKGVLLNFWGTWCPPCEEEMPYTENQYHAQDGDIETLAVNVGESEVKVDRFVNRHELTFPILLDRNRGFFNAYGAGPFLL